MKKTSVWALGSALTLLLLLVGISLAQVETPSFELVQRIGLPRPRGMVYDANFDQFVLVDERNQLLLTDGRFNTRFTLYETGAYNAYIFSHHGRWLALAIDRRLELWDTQTGALLATFEPTGAKLATGPLFFSDDDSFLVVNSVVPAPQELRRSENDTRNLPWLWDVWNALDIESPRLPGALDAVTFFDYINAPVFVMTPGETARLLAPLQNRFFVLDALTQQPVNDVPTDRFEPDPFDVWFSAADRYIYVRSVDGTSLIQLDPATDQTWLTNPGYEQSVSGIGGLSNWQLSKQARIIGEANSYETNSLARSLLGDNYPQSYGNHPLTVMLLDVLKPVTVTRDQFAVLLYIHDEQNGRGYVEFVKPSDSVNMLLNPDGDHLTVRRYSGEVDVYDITSGALEKTFYPTYDDINGEHNFAYNKDGSQLIVDFQRFNTDTGEVIWQDLRYNDGFSDFAFSDDSRQLKTLDYNYSEWWTWDIATGQPVNTVEYDVQNEIFQQSADNTRYITRVYDPNDGTLTGIEIYNIATNEQVSFTPPAMPGRTVSQIVASPNWDNFIVVYSGGTEGDEIALHNLHDGLLWYFVGQELPAADVRDYRWYDNDTALVLADGLQNRAEPIYGLDYHPSGLPTCLVQAFPVEWTRWNDLWERLNTRLSFDRLATLTQDLCGVIAESATIEGVEAVFFPTATATRPPVVPTQSAVAGVPLCLTQRFSREALNYARDWRAMTEGLTPEEITEIEALLCEGLTGEPGSFVSGGAFNAPPNAEVITIDLATGARTSSTYAPPRPPRAPSRELFLVSEEFERQYRRYPDYARLSPDGTLFAVQNFTGHFDIYRLLKPYDTIAAEATSTSAVQIAGATQGPGFIAVQPTSTEPPQFVGQPQATITPTITPTSPPRAEATDEIVLAPTENVCPSTTTLYSLDNPPPVFDPPGRLLTYLSSNDTWVFNPRTGDYYPDESIPSCGRGFNCNIAPGEDWMFLDQDDLVVMRRDGTDAEVLYEERERPVWPNDIRWITENTLQYSYQEYIPARSRNPFTFLRRYDAERHAYSDPFFPQESITINQLPTSVVSRQPILERFEVLRVDVRDAAKFYIYDSLDDRLFYFARESGGMEFQWHPLGIALYYRYPDSAKWYIFDPETGEHRIFGEFLPGGEWSRDFRYRARWLSITDEQWETMDDTIRLASKQATRQPGDNVIVPTLNELASALPKLAVWDSMTGVTKTYCFPDSGTWTYGADVQWSPDNRWLVFTDRLRAFENFEVSRPYTVLIDLETGYMTALTFELNGVVGWIEGEARGE